MIITVDQHAYRRSDHLGTPVLRFVIQFALLALVVVGLALPAQYTPAAVFGGLALSTLAGFRLIFELSYRPNVRAVTPRDDGLFIETKQKKERHVGWNEIRRICSRPSLGVLELITPSGSVIIADTFRDFPELLEQILDRTTPRTPPPPRVAFNNPLTVHLFTGLALLALPASLYFYGGVLLLAWGVFLWGLAALLWLPRGVVITQTHLELHRLAGRRAIPLESIQDVELTYKRVLGRLRITIALALQNGAETQVDIHSSRRLKCYSALRRALYQVPVVQAPAAVQVPA